MGKFICFYLILITSTAFASEAVSQRIHHTFEGLRPQTMGNAFIALSDDENAIFYNPAALALVSGSTVSIDLVNLSMSDNFQKISGDLSSAQNSNQSDSVKMSEIFNIIEDNYGKAFSFRASMLNTIYTKPNLSFAFIPIDLSFEGTFHQSSGPSINTTVIGDTTLAIAKSGAFAGAVPKLVNGNLYWGVTGKFINRIFFSRNVNFLEFAADTNFVTTEDLLEGYGLDADLGLLYKSESLKKYNFSAATVVRNILEASFTDSIKLITKHDSDDHPEKLYRVIDFGFAATHPEKPLKGTLDFKDFGHPNWSFKKSTHLGSEYTWTFTNQNNLSARLGLNQYYLCAGLGTTIGLFNFDIATYSEDVGSRLTPTESRVYASKISFKW